MLVHVRKHDHLQNRGVTRILFARPEEMLVTEETAFSGRGFAQNQVKKNPSETGFHSTGQTCLNLCATSSITLNSKSD